MSSGCLFSDPVTLPCGHNSCKHRIMQHRDSNVRCECPSGRYPFYKKLDLHVHIFTSETAAYFRESAGRSGSQRVAEPGEVALDVCTDTKLKAVKSCPASYWTHPEAHRTSPPPKKHQLTDPVENLEGRMCRTHDKPLELFCETDRTCVCTLCPVLDHKSHQVVPLRERFEKEKSELGRKEAELHRLIQDRRLKIDEFRRSLKLSKETADRGTADRGTADRGTADRGTADRGTADRGTADRGTADGVQVFSALIRRLERARAELIRTIDEKQKAATTLKLKQLNGKLSFLLFYIYRRTLLLKLQVKNV